MKHFRKQTQMVNGGKSHVVWCHSAEHSDDVTLWEEWFSTNIIHSFSSYFIFIFVILLPYDLSSLWPVYQNFFPSVMKNYFIIPLLLYCHVSVRVWRKQCHVWPPWAPKYARGRSRGVQTHHKTGLWLTLQLLRFRSFGVHIRIEQRASRHVAVWSLRVAVRGRAFQLLEAVAVWVETQIRKLGRRVRFVAQSVVVEVVDIHKPFRPEFPADAFAVHGQVDELAYRGDTIHTTDACMAVFSSCCSKDV